MITHCHRDHFGAVGELAERYGAEVIAHHLDAPVIRGEAAMTEPVLLDWEVPLYERGLTLPEAPPTRVDREVGDGDALGFGDGAVVVHSPATPTVPCRSICRATACCSRVTAWPASAR